MSTVDRPLRKDAERNRERVLAAAREVFAAHGLEATLDDIAHHAGVGIGTVYRRFSDKDQLIDALFEERIGEIVTAAEEGLAIADPWEGFLHFMLRGLELQAADRGLKEVMLSSSRGQERVSQAREQIAPLASQLLQRAQDAGVVRADLAPTDIPLIQFAIAAIADYTSDVPSDAWRRISCIVIDGLRPQRDTTRPLTAEPLSFEDLGCAMGNAGRRRR